MSDVGTLLTGPYISLETCRRDGRGVSTPIWFVTPEGRLFAHNRKGFRQGQATAAQRRGEAGTPHPARVGNHPLAGCRGEAGDRRRAQPRGFRRHGPQVFAGVTTY